jgi:hypothetical protein
MCAAWLARTEQRLELIGFAQLMPSVVRFWPQQGEPDSLSRIPVLGPVPAWPSVGGSKYRRGMGAAEYGGVVGDADAQESHRRTEGYPRPDPCRYRESSGAEHHTAGAQNVHQASPQAYAHQVGRLRRDHLRWLAQRVEVDAREVRIMGSAKLSARTHIASSVGIHACDRPGARRRAGEPPPLTDVPFSTMLPPAIIRPLIRP